MEYKQAKDLVLDRLKNELNKDLFYHSYHHTLDVLNSVELIAVGEGIEGENLMLLKTAAVFHDMGFIIQYDDHERESCKLAKEILPSFNYSEEQQEKIFGMIMATKIPQSPKNHLEEILCDADLDYLGREDFWLISDRLFDELTVLNRMKDRLSWNQLQFKFLSAHKYFTKFGQKMRQAEKQDRISEIQAKIEAP